MGFQNPNNQIIYLPIRSNQLHGLLENNYIYSSTKNAHEKNRTNEDFPARDRKTCLISRNYLEDHHTVLVSG